MNCMKCGRETPSEQAFCEDCLLDMEKHPVKPGTAVYLPKHRDHAALKKTPKKRTVPLEEQVKLLKKQVRFLAMLLIFCIAAIAAMIYPTVHYLMMDHFEIGQNYTSIVATTTPAETLEQTGN